VIAFKKKIILLPLSSSFLLWCSFPGGGGLWPLLFIALVPLLHTVRRGSVKDAVLAGFLCGFLHFIVLLYWIIIVLGKYGGLPWFISLLALLALALYMTFYLLLFVVAAKYIIPSFSAGWVVWLLPTLWVGLDWLRGILFTGLPWMDLGYAFYRVPLLIQIADLVGHHGLTFLAVFFNVFVLLLCSGNKKNGSRSILLISALVLFTGIGLYSTLRLRNLDKKMAGAQHVVVGIVQGNIEQDRKWSPAQKKATVTEYLAATESLSAQKKPDFVVWPETALPFFPPVSPYMFALRQGLKKENIALLTGAPWYEIIGGKNRKIRSYNSALLLRPDGRLAGKYYKNHLVPFGEYVPLKRFLSFLGPLVESVGDFSPGRVETPLVWEDAKIGVLICFESVFPELTRSWVKAGANILVNLTNDAWYGKSSAPYQSLAMAVFRAVESRRSLVRSANTGISVFVDPSGRIFARSRLFTVWSKAREMVLSGEVTFWVQYGYLFGPICFFIGILAGCLAIFRGGGRRLALKL